MKNKKSMDTDKKKILELEELMCHGWNLDLILLNQSIISLHSIIKLISTIMKN